MTCHPERCAERLGPSPVWRRMVSMCALFDHPEPRRVSPGEYPVWEQALALLNPREDAEERLSWWCAGERSRSGSAHMHGAVGALDALGTSIRTRS
jgi:hypothetical protein